MDVTLSKSKERARAPSRDCLYLLMWMERESTCKAARSLLACPLFTPRAAGINRDRRSPNRKAMVMAGGVIGGAAAAC